MPRALYGRPSMPLRRGPLSGGDTSGRAEAKNKPVRAAPIAAARESAYQFQVESILGLNTRQPCGDRANAGFSVHASCHPDLFKAANGYRT